MIQKLQTFGLSEKEAQVYMAALALGAATAEQIAKQAEVKRSTTYVQIESLQAKGLMSSYDEGKKTFYAPESPETLERLLTKERKDLEVKEDVLAKELPSLMGMFESAGERPVVRYYEGKEGIVTMRDNALSKLGKGDELAVMFSYDLLFEKFSREEIMPFSEKRERKGIELKLLYTRKAGKLDKATLGAHTERRYIDPKQFVLRADFFVYKDTVALMALDGKIFGIEITGSAISESHRNIFELLWTLGEDE